MSRGDYYWPEPLEKSGSTPDRPLLNRPPNKALQRTLVPRPRSFVVGLHLTFPSLKGANACKPTSYCLESLSHGYLVLFW